MLKQRVVTAVTAGLVVLSVLIFGPPIAWRWMVWVCTSAGVIEFATMHQARWYGTQTIFSLLLLSVLEWFPETIAHPFSIYLIVALVVAMPVFSLNRVRLANLSIVTVGTLYIAGGGYFLASIRFLPNGWFWLWLFLIAVWMSDTAAYFTGRALKGPKLLVQISPKKTISGALGGVVGAAIGAVVFGAIAHPVLDYWAYACIGAVISIASQLGDLVESAYKRSAGVKDSGKMLPGHGGMLDRIDGLLFAAPFAYWFILHGISGWLI